MPSKKTWVIAKREYLSRLKTKGFWISTVALPLLMAAWLVLPTLIMTKTKSSLDLAVVVAYSGSEAPKGGSAQRAYNERVKAQDGADK